MGHALSWAASMALCTAGPAKGKLVGVCLGERACGGVRLGVCVYECLCGGLPVEMCQQCVPWVRMWCRVFRRIAHQPW